MYTPEQRKHVADLLERGGAPANRVAEVRGECPDYRVRDIVDRLLAPENFRAGVLTYADPDAILEAEEYLASIGGAQ